MGPGAPRRRYLALVPLKGRKPTRHGRYDDDDTGSDRQRRETKDEEEGGGGSGRAVRGGGSTPAAAWARGPTRESLEVERLTVKAWNALAGCVREQEPGVELEVLGMVEDAAHCDASVINPETTPHVTCVALDAACRHPEFGIMTLDCILRAAWDHGHAPAGAAAGDGGGAAPPDVYILANGDIIFTPTLLHAIGLAYGTFVEGQPPPMPPPHLEQEQRAAGEEAEAEAVEAPAPLFVDPGTHGFALVGRRLDLNVTLPSAPEDPPLTEESLLTPGLAVRMHQATGIDYFAFTADAFPHAFPPFLIGRWRWDNALLLHFLLQAGVATLDGSEVVHALHLGMSHSSSSAQHRARAGGRYNDELVAATTGRAHALGRIDMAAYVLKAPNATASETGGGGEEGPKPYFAPRLALERRGRTMGAAQLAALRLAGGPGAGLENGAVTIVPVPFGATEAALEWACWARRRAGAGGFLLLAADEEEAEALVVALAGMGMDGRGRSGTNGGGAVVHLHPGAVSVQGGAGGNLQYYRDKKTGRASAAALELGAATVVQRLLRLNLTVTVADLALRWNRDPRPLLLRGPPGGGGGGEPRCDLTLLDFGDSSGGGGSVDASAGAGAAGVAGAPLYLLRPSLETLHQWRRVLSCMEDRIRHPARYLPGFSCVRARLLDALEGIEENGSEDDEGRGRDDDGGEEEVSEGPPPPWRACRVHAHAPGSWFPARSEVWRRQQQQPHGLSSSGAEPWGVLLDSSDGGTGEAGRLWDEAAGQCVGELDGWLLEAIEPPRVQEARD